MSEVFNDRDGRRRDVTYVTHNRMSYSVTVLHTVGLTVLGQA